MDVLLLEVSYDSGQHRRRMGMGPAHLVERGAVARLEAAGHRVRHHAVVAPASFPLEMGTAFSLFRSIATEVARAGERGEFPLVLSGNCNSAVGTVSGLGDPSIGIVWLDAHGDLETPETTVSGYFDGMGLAILAGEAFRACRESVPGFRIVPGERILLGGSRQVSEAERALIARSGATYLTVDELRAGGLPAGLDRLARAGVKSLYLHVDLDVHDPSIAPANSFAEPNGLLAEEVRDLLRAAAARFPVRAGALASYDPGCDREGRMLGVGLELIGMLPGLAAGPALSLPGLRCAPIQEEGALQRFFERCADAFPQMHGRPPRPGDAGALLSLVPPGCARADKHVIGIHDGDEMVAVVDVVRGYPEPTTWFVGLLLIDPARRGHGLGERIMAALGDAVRAAGGTRFELVVQDTNPRALRFWTRLGFAPVSRGAEGLRVLGRSA